MADLSQVHDDLGQIHKLAKELFENHHYNLNADLDDAAGLLGEVRELATQCEKDFLALAAAVSKTRG